MLATATAGILSGVVVDLSGKASAKGKAFGDELQSEVRIINDPSKVANNPVLYYVKNTGSTTLDYARMTVIVDGTVISPTITLLGGETAFRYGVVSQVSYASNQVAGDHYVQVVMENGVASELRYRM